ncbi:dehydrogenase/reductase SDR family member on chromosome X [Pteronotus mesoamericanus]|uniref:dehydrogenase/reductase SDR family member on chromosome X n=1 Tax=Pteronotus mesoamericanus TaxID=1884717 RepID=UPI0023EBBA6F|nr:dehydrogenase/reductase SDR family member on chromosome X [Pteronotus parnellii mesoamericanus]
MSPLSAARAALRVYAVGTLVILAQLLRRCLGGFAEPVFPGQADRVAIVTGGTAGLGYATAKQLAKLGMRVVIAGNDRAKAEETVRKIQEETWNDKVEFLYCNLASLQSVREFVHTFKKKKLPLHVLVNNAGVMMVPQRKTVDGFEEHFGLNYLGHFLLTNLLLDTLKESGRPGRSARVVSLSSATHYIGELRLDDLQGSTDYSPHGAYAQSKLALVLFTYHLQRLLAAQGSHVTANAADPGVVNTDLYRHTYWGTRLFKKLFGRWVFKSPEEGAWTSTYAAVTPELEGLGGRYLYNEREVRSLAATYDTHLQEELWARSCAMTGLADVTPDIIAGRLPRGDSVALSPPAAGV